MIGIVKPKDLRNREKEFKKFIDKAMPYNSGEMSTEDVFKGVYKGDYSLWACLDSNGSLQSVMVFNVISFPQKRALNIMVVVSDNMELNRDEFMKAAEIFAKQNDCSSIYLHGREGWGRVLEPYGYKQPYIVLEKKLNG